MVSRIELHDDGKTTTVSFLSGKKHSYPTTDYQPAPQADLVGNLDRFGLMGLELFPIRINKKHVVIDKRGVINHQEVFKAVCNGYTIDLSVMQDSKGKANIIDI